MSRQRILVRGQRQSMCYQGLKALEAKIIRGLLRLESGSVG